ncbi:hypothetical protein [Halovivax gelatinilyticus]|uniref:hypothetical protein n=1 Tax=Halovivax gelatinilyticus TaxID=2961597 RepID=UPI0020CA4BB7|nr:hypothetical protein [Halovivax gelatinilyticus]
MNLEPEEYGAYWGASIRIAIGFLVVSFGTWFAGQFLSQGPFGARALGAFLLAGFVLVGTFVAVLGFARVVRTAVGAELRG